MIKKEDTKAITDIANENWDYTCALIDAQKLGRSELEKKYAAYYNLAIKFIATIPFSFLILDFSFSFSFSS